MMTWIVAMFVAGIVLVLLEFVLPGLICGIAGTILLVASIGLGVHSYPEYAAQFVIGGGITAVAVFALGMWMVPRLGYKSGLVQGRRQELTEGYVNAPERTDLLHREGTVFSALRPAGAIVVDSERLDAVSMGEFIDKGATVRIIAVEGNRIVVEAI